MSIINQARTRAADHPIMLDRVSIDDATYRRL
jgi:hypothetical protein